MNLFGRKDRRRSENADLRKAIDDGQKVSVSETLNDIDTRIRRMQKLSIIVSVQHLP